VAVTTETATGALGRPYPNVNSVRHVQGRGRFIADVHLPGERHVAVLRSPVAHARIRAIDVSAAAAVPGVDLVVTGADVVADTEPAGYLWDLPTQRDSQTRCLAHDTVRYVGEAVAAVVAVDRATAEDAAELIEVDYEPLPVVMTISQALADEAPRLYADWPDNVSGTSEWNAGDAAGALAGADLVLRETFRSQRVHALPLEPRGVVATADPDGLTVWTSTQSIHQIRSGLARTLRRPQHRIRVIAPDIGGAFGCKACLFPEETLVGYLATRVGRPVRWMEDRAEAMLATTHARDLEITLELGFTSDGTISGLRSRHVVDCGGAVYATGMSTAWVSGALVSGPYRLSDISIDVAGVVTNKTPTGAYRGYGQPEANFALERMLDLAAARLGIDPAELRRRNLVTPEEMPYLMPTGLPLDSGRYPELLDLVLRTFDWEGTRREVERARADGRLLGAGLACYAETTNFGPSSILTLLGITESGFDTSVVRVEPSGDVRLLTSQTPMGQGVETVLAQTVADALAIPMESVSVVHGDTFSSPFTGYASGGSRAAGVAGSSALLAAGRARDKMRTIAAHLLEANEDDLDLAGGAFSVRGSPSKQVTMADVARAAYLAVNLPEGLEPGIETIATFDPPSVAFSYGVVAALAEVSPDTGQVTLHRLVFGHDCGPQLNPAIVRGQVEGGVVQGIGAALYEEVPYDDQGQPRVALLLDYPVPLAPDVPPITLVHLETPSPFSANGAKGVGESGVIATPAAIANAVQAALPSGSPPIVSLPIRAEWILDTLEAHQ
jgi:aerobic carbon-monoxide dehydrogenase large subunit